MGRLYFFARSGYRALDARGPRTRLDPAWMTWPNPDAMKVLRLTPLLDFGGVEKRLVNTAQYQDSAVEFVFVALDRGGWAAEQIAASGGRVILLHTKYRIPSLPLLWKLWRLIRREAPDAVHASGAEANFHGLIAARLGRVPVVIAEEIGFPNHSRAGRLTFKLIYLCCDKMIAISEAVKERVVQLGEVPPGKIAVIYNPVSLPALTPRGSNEARRIRLLMVSRIEAVKNIPAVLEILAELKTSLPPFELTIVGDGSDLPSLRDLRSELGLTEEVVFAGFQPDPRSYYAASDVFLLPSFAEGLSNSLLEAMAHGMVCIATRIGGPRELIQEGETGYLVDPYSRESIRAALVRVLTMPEGERRRLGENARAFTETKFSLTGYVEQLKQVYRGES